MSRRLFKEPVAYGLVGLLFSLTAWSVTTPADSAQFEPFEELTPQACEANMGTVTAGDESHLEHGGGLNKCGCHFNRKTGQCHCHKAKGCGCECQPAKCD